AHAERFRPAVGDTPRNCPTRRPMHLASAAIRDGKRSIAAIASSIGYLSEPAFIKAFRRHFGMTPGRYRATVMGRGVPADLAQQEQAQLVESHEPAREPAAATIEDSRAPNARRAFEGTLYREARF